MVRPAAGSPRPGGLPAADARLCARLPAQDERERPHGEQALRGPEQDALRNPARLFGHRNQQRGTVRIRPVSRRSAEPHRLPPQGHAGAYRRRAYGGILAHSGGGGHDNRRPGERHGDVRPDGIARRIRRGGIQDSTLGKPHREQLGRVQTQCLRRGEDSGDLCGCTADTVRCGPGRTPPLRAGNQGGRCHLPLRARRESGTGPLLADDSERGKDRHPGIFGGRQDHPVQHSLRLFPARIGRGTDRRYAAVTRQHPAVAGPPRLRVAGRLHSRHDAGREHCLRKTKRRDRCRAAAAGHPGRFAHGARSLPATGYGHCDGRSGVQALRRTAAAHRHRTRPLQERIGAALRRGHLIARQPDGTGNRGGRRTAVGTPQRTDHPDNIAQRADARILRPHNRHRVKRCRKPKPSRTKSCSPT